MGHSGKFLVAAAVIAFVPGMALAQQAPADNSGDQQGIADIVVTAQKRAESSQVLECPILNPLTMPG